MEGHPIPQDITGFQFKLIGDMTIKQFAYLAVGVGGAWLFFVLHLPPFIKYPFSFIFALLGVSLAFLPLEGRPMDVMLSNFVKALFAPTQFIYQKMGGHFWFPSPTTAITKTNKPTSSISQDEFRAFLQSLPKRPKNELDEKEISFFKSLTTLLPAPSFPPTVVAPIPVSEPKEVSQEPEKQISKDKEEKIESQAKLLEQELEEAKKQEVAQTSSAGYAAAHQKVLELEKLLNQTLAQKQELERQILSLQKKLEAQKKEVFTPGVATAKRQTQNVRVIPKGLGKSVGLPILPEVPNIISGIIKDPRNNPLPNILVEVKDNEGNPVRAFKTNGVGQFASATPLSNGIYRVEFEDPKNEAKFDAVEIQANGEIIMPLEIISVDKREELRKELFGN